MFPSRNPEFDGPTVVEIETKSSRAGEESTPNSPKITKNLKNMGLENRSHRVTDEEAVQEDGKQTKLEEVRNIGIGAGVTYFFFHVQTRRINSPARPRPQP